MSIYFSVCAFIFVKIPAKKDVFLLCQYIFQKGNLRLAAVQQLAR